MKKANFNVSFIGTDKKPVTEIPGIDPPTMGNVLANIILGSRGRTDAVRMYNLAFNIANSTKEMDFEDSDWTAIKTMIPKSSYATLITGQLLKVIEEAEKNVGK